MDTELLLEKLKTYPLAIICTVLGLACAVGLYLRADVVSEISIQEADLNATLRVIEENVKNAINLQEHLDEVLALTAEIDERIFYPEQRAININFFYNVEKEYAINFSAMTQQGSAAIYGAGGSRELSLYSTMVYNLAMSAPLEKVLELMHGLEESKPLIRIGTFRVSDAGGTEVRGRAAGAGAPADDDSINAAFSVMILSAKK